MRRFGRTVSEVASELGCDWHTVNREVMRWGDALLEADVSRFGSVEAVGVDETPVLAQGEVEDQAVVHAGRGRGRASVVGHSAW